MTKKSKRLNIHSIIQSLESDSEQETNTSQKSGKTSSDSDSDWDYASVIDYNVFKLSIEETYTQENIANDLFSGQEENTKNIPNVSKTKTNYNINASNNANGKEKKKVLLNKLRSNKNNDFVNESNKNDDFVKEKGNFSKNKKKRNLKTVSKRSDQKKINHSDESKTEHKKELNCKLSTTRIAKIELNKLDDKTIKRYNKNCNKIIIKDSNDQGENKEKKTVNPEKDTIKKNDCINEDGLSKVKKKSTKLDKKINDSNDNDISEFGKQINTRSQDKNYIVDKEANKISFNEKLIESSQRTRKKHYKKVVPDSYKINDVEDKGNKKESIISDKRRIIDLDKNDAEDDTEILNKSFRRKMNRKIRLDKSSDSEAETVPQLSRDSGIKVELSKSLSSSTKRNNQDNEVIHTKFKTKKIEKLINRKNFKLNMKNKKTVNASREKSSDIKEIQTVRSNTVFTDDRIKSKEDRTNALKESIVNDCSKLKGIEKHKLSSEVIKAFRYLSCKIKQNRSLLMSDFYPFSVSDMRYVLKLNDQSMEGTRKDLIKTIKSNVQQGCPPRCPNCKWGHLKYVKKRGKWMYYCPGFYTKYHWRGCSFTISKKELSLNPWKNP